MASCKIVLSKTARKCKKTFCLAIAAISLFSLSGCSNNPYPEEDVEKPTLQVAILDDPKTLDPTTAADSVSSNVIDVIFPSFYKYHYLKRKPLVLELGLGAEPPKRTDVNVVFAEPPKIDAKSKEEGPPGEPKTSKGETWTFKIKKGLRFQDDPCFPGGRGREITADDFIFSLKRQADPRLEGGLSEILADLVPGFWQFSAKNKKIYESGGKVDYGVPITGIERDPVDPYSFSITFRHKYPQIEFQMARHFTSPLPHEAIEKYGAEFARHPVGCGAFYLEEYRPRSRIVLRANPNRMPEYYPSEGSPGDVKLGLLSDEELGLLEDKGKLLPLVERVQFNIIRESITAWNFFLQGYLDSSAVTQTNFEQAIGASGAGKLSEEMSGKGIKMTHSPRMNILQFGFNMTDEQVGGYTEKHRKLRQAITLSVDSQEFIDLAALGVGTPAQTMLPPSVIGYDPSYRNPYRKPDIAKAKTLLAEAGYPNGIDPKTGKKFVLVWENANVTPSARQMTGIIKKQIERLGISVDTRSVPFSVITTHIRQGLFQFTDMHWTADYPDSENFYFLLNGPDVRPGQNGTAYDNPEFNRLFALLRPMSEGEERQKILTKLRDIAVEDCPQVYLSHAEDLILMQSWTKNYKPHPVSNEVYKYRRVDGSLRKKLRESWNQPLYWPVLVAIGIFVLINIPTLGVIRRRSSRKIRRIKEETR